MRDARLGRIPDVRDFYILQAERDRALRLDEQERKLQEQNPQRAQREQLDLREYNLFLNSGVYAASADEQAFNRAKATRDQALITADDQRRAAVAATPGQRPQIEQNYQDRVKQIRQDYEKERARIFGSGITPATAPAP
jgi:protoporphyrinogen oxidase